MDAEEAKQVADANNYEVVMLFGADEDIASEMFFAEFETLLSGAAKLDACAGSVTKAAYCIVGNGLALKGLVFFLFNVDEEGVVDPAFNLPLRYLAENAGAGPDLGQGPIRKASRGQCPVPWHSVHLWEPTNPEAIDLVQRRVYRNKLKLKSSTVVGAPQVDDELVSGEVELAPGTENAALEARLTDTFGEAGKLSLQDVIRLHKQQLEETKLKYRDDLEQHQQTYLDQIRDCREQIHELKVALRQEQSRNQRLQQMLRGEI
jgi:hypothetical protein